MPSGLKIPAVSKYLRASARGAIGVDRDAKVIRGYVMAQKGLFKSEGRGQFDDRSLDLIVKLANQAPLRDRGLRSRWTHPTLSADGLGKHLGRAYNVRRDGDKVRGDLHLSETAFEGNPNGNLGQYVLDLAEEDPDAISSSLVLDTDYEFLRDDKGRAKKDADGNEIPPVWLPKKLFASDIVDTGDAVDGLLSIDGLPDAIVRRATEMIDAQFGEEVSREVLTERMLSWFAKYLELRYGDEDTLSAGADRVGTPVDVLRKKLHLQRIAVDSADAGA